MPDVLLLNPPLYDTHAAGKVDYLEHWSPPLGIASIAAALETLGVDVRAFDLYYLDERSWQRTISENMGKIVGISCFTDQRASTYRLVEYIRSLDKEVTFGSTPNSWTRG